MHPWCGALAVPIPALSLNSLPWPLMKPHRSLLSRGSTMHLLLLTEYLPQTILLASLRALHLGRMRDIVCMLEMSCNSFTVSEDYRIHLIHYPLRR